MIDISVLKSTFELLSELSDTELEAFSDKLSEKQAKKGSYIVYQNDTAKNLFFILSGEVKINLVSREGKEIVLSYLKEGDFFGELAILTGGERTANVVAQTATKLLMLPESKFHEMLETSPGFSLALMRSLAERLRDATTKIGDLALFDVYRRVARTLKSLGTRVESSEGQTSYVIENRPTHQELASNVGTSREMVTRALKGLEEDGCVRIDGKRLELLKMPR